MLIIQIALGIVLAVVIIAFWRELSVFAIGALIVVGVVVIILFGGAYVYKYLNPAPAPATTPVTTPDKTIYLPDSTLKPEDIKNFKIVDFGVFQDQSTGLMWVKNGNVTGKQMHWYDANTLVINLSYGGYRDWRLPTKEELEYFMKQKPLNSNIFKNVQHDYYWTSSTPDAYPNNAASVNSVLMSAYYMQKSSSGSVWPVRDTRK